MGGFYLDKRSRKKEPAPALSSVWLEWTLSEVPVIRALQLEVGAGKCPFCERLLKKKPRGRNPIVCFRADCQIEWHREYQRQPRWRTYNTEAKRKQRRARIKAGLNWRGEKRKLPLYKNYVGPRPSKGSK